MKKAAILTLVLFCSLAFISCEVGMGPSVDLEAPTVTVNKMISGGETQTTTTTNFETSVYCKQNVIFSGTAQDNEKLSNVHAEVKWAGEDSYHFLQNASLSGNEWTLNITFSREGACYLKIVAEDGSGNYGIKSSKVITLFVDNNAPVGNGWYIDRKINGIQYSLQSLDALKEIIRKDPQLSEPSNIDVAQNVEFDICSNFTDASGIQNVSISIWDEEGHNVISSIANSNENSNYAPRFKITGSGLPATGADSGTKPYYYQVRYSAKDTVTDPEPNEVTDQEISLGWFVWWPEKDNPRYSITGLTTEGGTKTLNLHVGDTFNITFFDDDYLKDNVVCTLGTEITTKSASNNPREITVQLTAPSTPKTITLNVSAKEKGNKTINENITVNVSDDSKPTLIITSPENNQIPSVTGNDANIKFTGIVLDKSDCTYLEFVWVPKTVQDANPSIDKKTKAENWLNSISTAHGTYAPSGTTAVRETAGTGDYEGMKLWSAKLKTPATNAEQSGFKKKEFEFNLNLLTAFTSGSTNEKAEEKYFLVRLTRTDGKYSDSELKLSADNLKPEIKLLTPGGNMAIVDPGNTLNIKFYAEKASAIPMEEYKLWYFDGTTETEISGTTAIQTVDEKSVLVFTSSDISSSTLNGYLNENINPKYKFYAKDKLGNDYKTEPAYQFVLSALPSINTITSQAPTKCGYNPTSKDAVGNELKDANGKVLGKAIDINVSFTKSLVCPDNAVLNLQNIKNNGTAKTATAKYFSGSGTTTLTFRYYVEEGDESAELKVNGTTPISGIDSNTAHLTLSSGNNLQDKRASNPIKINGKRPEVQSILIDAYNASERTTASKVAANEDGSIYLKEGREIEAKVTIDQEVTVKGQASLSFNVHKVDNSTAPLILEWQGYGKNTDGSTDEKVLIFSKKIAATDPNGTLKYKKNTCITGLDNITDKDGYQNTLKVDFTGGNSEASAGIVIDTQKPLTPKISGTVATDNDVNGVLKGKKYTNSVSFTITSVAGECTQYSTDGGTNWEPSTLSYAENSTAISVTQTTDADLVARRTDKAGNVSDYTTPINLQVNSTFPSYTIECTKPDGNYKAGTELEFKVYFDAPVKIASGSEAYIKLSGYNTSSDHTDENTKATLNTTKTLIGSSTQEATFTYKTRDPDEFTLKVAKGDVVLLGITDEYGIPGATKNVSTGAITVNKELDAEYPRQSLHCDGVAPKVEKMEFVGSSQTQIKLTFTEDVQLGSGKIYLRQVKGWAIPPVLKATEFNTICNAFPSDYKYNGSAGKNILSVQENGADMEDSSWDGNNTNGPANSGYHGTGQYVGPYKKGTQGLSGDSPDKTTKYVLDFDMDIWETNTTRYYGKTGGKGTNAAYSAPSANPRTADDIRAVLEKVHYHERYLSVTSTTLSTTNKKEVTINFPKGLLGDVTLPAGRKWELVIEKGCFMDKTGNKFGAEANGKIKQADAVQDTASAKVGKQYTVYSGAKDTDGYDKYTGSWARGRYATVSGGEEASLTEPKPVVLIKNNGAEFFESTGVAKPWIRVDRYSYGYGIFQGTANGGASQIANGGTTKPSGYVRVRVDCETEGASVSYSITGKTKSASNVSSTADYINDGANSYISAADSGETVTSTGTGTGIFAFGINDYKKSFRGVITAEASKGSATAQNTEGIFRTVVCCESPTTENGTRYGSRNGTGSVFSVRGTTGFAGEPSISPFPLRDNLIGSPFVRQTYKDGNNYYWVSYEILVMSSISGYGSSNNNANDFNWMRNWGQMNPGEFSRITGFRCWN